MHVRLTVHVKAGAKTTEVVRWHDQNTVSIRVAAPAKEGKANRALISFISARCHVPPSSVLILRGLSTPIKHLEIPVEALDRLRLATTGDNEEAGAKKASRL